MPQEYDMQFYIESSRLADLVEKFVDIPRDKTLSFLLDSVSENPARYLSSLCETEAQEEKLGRLFEFKSVYETISLAENKAYVLNSPNKIVDYVKSQFPGNLEKEQVIAIYADNKLNVIKSSLLSLGTVRASLLSPREVALEAINNKASYVILSHNHPSGDCTPSEADKEVTGQICAAMQILEISLVDHIITGGNHYFSFIESGLLAEYKKGAENLLIAIGTAEESTPYNGTSAERSGIEAAASAPNAPVFSMKAIAPAATLELQ